MVTIWTNWLYVMKRDTPTSSAAYHLTPSTRPPCVCLIGRRDNGVMLLWCLAALPPPRSTVMPSAGGRKRLEHKVALKESRSGTSIPVLVHGMWKGKRKAVLVARDEKLDFPSNGSCGRTKPDLLHFAGTQLKALRGRWMQNRSTNAYCIHVWKLSRWRQRQSEG